MKSGESIKKHRWFKYLDWKKIEKQEIKTPWRPSLENIKDTKYFSDFDNEFEKDVEKIKVPEEYKFLYENF